LKEIVKKCISLSHAEIARACDDAIKEAILNDKETVDKELLTLMIAERNSVYQRGE